MSLKHSAHMGKKLDIFSKSVYVCVFVFQVYVEFESNRDADRLGIWYSLLKEPPGYEIYRLKAPHGVCTSVRKFNRNKTDVTGEVMKL